MGEGAGAAGQPLRAGGRITEGHALAGAAPLLPYARIVGSMLDGVLVVSAAGEVVLANEAAARIFGVPQAELRRPIVEYAASFQLRLPGGEPAPPLPGRALEGELSPPVERLLTTPGGVERTIRSSAAPLRDDHGAVLGAVVLVGDVTAAAEEVERAREREAELSRAHADARRAAGELSEHQGRLRVALERLRAHVESTPLALVEWDAEYRVVGFSPRAEELFGWRAAEVLGRRIDEIPWVPAEDWPSLEQVLRDMASGARPSHMNANRNLRKDGSVIYCEWYNSTIHDEAGQLVSVLSLVLDVTERTRAEQALREEDRRKTEFLAVLSHELRNPLAPIRNGIYLLERVPADSPQAARARQVIRRQSDHLTRLVDDLLDVTRIARGKIQLRREVVDLRELVRRTCEDHRAAFEERAIALEVDLPGAPVLADADPTRLAQVTGNLLVNAEKFTPDGGAVAVRLRAAGGAAELAVRDSGVGIEPAHLARMFEPFSQEARSRPRARGGLGLGLALSKGLVELHGGSMSGRSEGPGKGAEFTVRLPLAAAAPEPAAPLARPRAGPRRTVLVIEDNADAARTLADVLEVAGHDVAVARDGATGIALARERHPDVVICDLGLPDVDGYEIARTLRRDEGLQGTRLIALSGWAQHEDQARAREAGFEAHLSKPAPIDELTALLG